MTGLNDKVNTLTDEARDNLITEVDNGKIPNNPSSNFLSTKEYYGLKLLAHVTETRLTSKEQEGLTSDEINSKLQEKNRLTNKELLYLQNFLVEKMGDMKFNKKLSKLIHNDLEAIPGDNIAQTMISFTYSTQRFKEFYEIANKLDDIYHNIDNNHIEVEAITLNEYGVINRSRNLISTWKNEYPDFYLRETYR